MKKFIAPIIFASMLISFGCTQMSIPPQNNTQTQKPPTNNPTQTQPPRNDIVCTQEYAYGLTIDLKDEKGTPIEKAKVYVIAQEKGPEASEFEQIGTPGRYIGIGEGEGKYTVRIEKEGYESQELTVDLEHDECHVHPQSRNITLKLKP